MMLRFFSFLFVFLLGVDLLSAQADGGFSFGGDFRFRQEYASAAQPLANAQTEALSTLRSRLYFESTINQHIATRIEAQSSVFDSSEQDLIELRQAWLRLDHLFATSSLELGRFLLDYGDGRMVSSNDWSVTGRAWDGVRWQRKDEDSQLDLFWVNAVERLGTEPDVDSALGGAYFTFSPSWFDAQCYLLHRKESGDALVDYSNQTYGFLLSDAWSSALNWSAEFAIQSGDYRDLGELDGHALALGLNWTLASGFELGLAYERASGEKDTTDDTYSAFQPLFPDEHAWQGQMDLFAWTNLQDVCLSASHSFSPSFSTSLEWHHFSVAREGGNSPFLDSTLALDPNESDLGSEIDFYFQSELASHATLLAGVSIYSPGDALLNSDSQKWAFASISMSF